VIRPCPNQEEWLRAGRHRRESAFMESAVCALAIASLGLAKRFEPVGVVAGVLIPLSLIATLPHWSREFFAEEETKVKSRAKDATEQFSKNRQRLMGWLQRSTLVEEQTALMEAIDQLESKEEREIVQSLYCPSPLWVEVWMPAAFSTVGLGSIYWISPRHWKMPLGFYLPMCGLQVHTALLRTCRLESAKTAFEGQKECLLA